MIQFLKEVSVFKLAAILFALFGILITVCFVYKTLIPAILILSYMVCYSLASVIKVIIGDENGNKD